MQIRSMAWLILGHTLGRDPPDGQNRGMKVEVHEAGSM